MESFRSPANDEYSHSIRIKELEKKLKDSSLKITELQNHLKTCSDELSQQVDKYRIACEARDESKFSVVNLESDVKKLRLENENLRLQIKEQKESKSAEVVSLEAVVASYADQIEKYKEKFEITDGWDVKCIDLEGNIKVLKLENESLKSQMKEMESESSSEIKSLNEKVASYKQQIQKYCEQVKAHDTCENKITELENHVKSLSLENENLKFVMNKQENTRSDEIQSLKTVIASYADQVQNYQEEIKENKKENTLLVAQIENLKSSLLEKQRFSLNPSSAERFNEGKGKFANKAMEKCHQILTRTVIDQAKRQSQLQCDINEVLLLMNTFSNKKENEFSPSPLRTQNSKLQKSIKAEKLPTPKATKTSLQTGTPQQAKAKKVKIIQNENECISTHNDTSRVARNKTSDGNVNFMAEREKRNLRPRRKIQ